MDDADYAEAALEIDEVMARPNARRDVLAPLLWAMTHRASVSACTPKPGRLGEVVMRTELVGLDYLAAELRGSPPLVLTFGRVPDEALRELAEGPTRVRGEDAAGLVFTLVGRGAAVRFSERWARWAREQKPRGGP